jgi:hypothetical protein
MKLAKKVPDQRSGMEVDCSKLLPAKCPGSVSGDGLPGIDTIGRGLR